MRINEVFDSVQGEGRYTGYPVKFIRTSGCNRRCDFCDTKYHTRGSEISNNELVKIINDSPLETVVWTGGEPMLWENDIYDVIVKTPNTSHHLETNGDYIPKKPYMFQYIGFSPKEKSSQIKVIDYMNSIGAPKEKYDIKIVTDLKLNADMIDDATILMPLSTYEPEDDLRIQRNVWDYCVKNNIKYASRIQAAVWGQKIGK